MQINRNTGRPIYINASCVQINVFHPKDTRTNLFFQAMQVGDPLLGEVLHCSFSATSMRLLEVPASNSWLTLCWLQNFSSWGTSEGATFPKNVPTSSPHALLATGASRILVLDSKCPDSHLCWFTLINGEQQGGWCVGCGAERGVSKCVELAEPCRLECSFPPRTTPVIQLLTVWGPGGPGWCGTSAVL